MLAELETEQKVIGAKQSCKAIRRGDARHVFLAEDADPQITDPVRNLCTGFNIPVTDVPHMKSLGKACGIDLGCAAATLLIK